MATKKIAKKAGLAVFAKHMDDYKPPDPYYEVYIDKKGREKRRRVSRGPVAHVHWALGTGHCSVC
jgi:hypothetical protein